MQLIERGNKQGQCGMKERGLFIVRIFSAVLVGIVLGYFMLSFPWSLLLTQHAKRSVAPDSVEFSSGSMGQDTVIHTSGHSQWKACLFLYQGNFYSRIGRGGAALDSYKKAVQVQPGNSMFLQQFVVQAQKERDYLQLIRILRPLSSLLPDDLEYLEYLADAFQATGQIDQELAVLKRMCVLKESAIHYAGLGSAYERSSRLNQAVEAYKRAIQLEPEKAEYHSRLGNVYLQTDDLTSAVSEKRKAFTLVPNDVQYPMDLALIYLEAGQPVQARKTAENIPPQLRFGFFFKAAGLMREKGRNREAVQYYQEALRLRPDSILCRMSLGDLYREAGKDTAALQQYSKARFLEPESAKLFRMLGDSYRAMNKLEDSLTMYQAALSLQPDTASYHSLVGQVYRELGDQDKALKYAQEAIRLYPDGVWYRSSLGEYYRELGNIQAAIEQYRKIRNLRPYMGMYARILGDLYRQIGKYEDALAMYQAALSLQPDMAYYHSLVSMVYLDMGKPDKALKYAQGAVRLNPAKPAYKNLLLKLNKNINMVR